MALATCFATLSIVNQSQHNFFVKMAIVTCNIVRATCNTLFGRQVARKIVTCNNTLGRGRTGQIFVYFAKKSVTSSVRQVRPVIF